MPSSGDNLSVLLLDLDGVLRRWDPAIISGAELRNGLPVGALATAAFGDRERLRAAVTGELDDPGWRESIADELAARYGAGGRQAVRDWSASAGEVDPAVLELVRRTRGRLRVALLSNATSRLEQDLDLLGLTGELDAVFSSYRLRAAKPEHRVFELVCDRLGVPPAGCLFVDDTAEHVGAAVEVGLRGHCYRGVMELAALLDQG